jgi:hypothetical protein
LFDGVRDPKPYPDSLRRKHALERQDAPYARLRTRLLDTLRVRNGIQDSLAGVMVMEELPERRPAHLLDRGAYDAPRERVDPSTPASILPFPDALPRNRLGLATWLVDERNPLTARVAVNRYWQMLFGRGIVETTEDFGSQGALPTHPELLDWLAATFVESGWDLRALLKRIVMSTPYRQASTTSLEKRARDPENLWLARGPGHRLSAEFLRDQALAASGLLVQEVGGPSVKPYQPPGLWAEKSEFTILKAYVPDEGPDQYRRSMYTFWRRTSPPPAMTLFDAPTRDNCTVRRQRTSTPLQALVLLNDPQFVEAARVLAARAMRTYPDAPREQLTLAYRLLTGHRPDAESLGLLEELLNEEVTAFSGAMEEATALLQVGNAPQDSNLEPAHHAALTVAVNTMMSFQATVDKR